MTKRQWFLVAGTLVLAACQPIAGLRDFACEENDDNGWTDCSAVQTTQPDETPAASIDQPVDQSEPN